MAFGKGWDKIKLYFMIGLPFENKQDIVQIVELIEKIIMAAKEKLDKKKLSRLKINISINVFCPKPFTPFQWVGLDDPEILRDKFNYILANVPKRYVNVRWADPYRSMVECGLSTGSQLMGDVIENSWRNGAKFDSWSDFFDFDIWEESFKKAGLDINFFTTRGFSVDEVLPWDIIDIGVRKKTLLREYEKSKKFI
jgi:radical SAM superfamily enzyme YgiQ (UPF0313 family)